MNKKVIELKEVIFQHASDSGLGTQLELLAADGEGKQIDINFYPLCRFVSTVENKILFEIYDEKRIIRFPLEGLEKSLQLAKVWVKNEESFDKLPEV